MSYMNNIDTNAATATQLPGASPASVGFSPERLDRMDDAMQTEIDAGHYAAISVMVARHGKLVKFQRYGRQSLESHEPLRDDAIFRIASMTKNFTAAAVLLLRDEGALALDDPAGKYVPQVASMRLASPDSPAITIRNLLTMTAGFPTDDPWGDRQQGLGQAVRVRPQPSARACRQDHSDQALSPSAGSGLAGASHPVTNSQMNSNQR